METDKAKRLAEAAKMDQLMFHGEGATRERMLAAERIGRAWNEGKDFVTHIGPDGIARALYVRKPPRGYW